MTDPFDGAVPRAPVLDAVGEAGAAARSADWAATPLGSPSAWPPALRTAAGMVLASRFPMALMWGPDHAFLYNDGLLPVLGRKHPGALGRPSAEVWAEVWSEVGPLLGAVLRTGEPTWHQDARFLIDRRGFAEEAYFTFSYSPVRDDAGAVAGILVAVLETTDYVLARRRQRTLAAVSAAARAVVDRGRDEGVRAVADAAVADGADLPFLLVYRAELETGLARRAAAAGRAGAAPMVLGLDDDDPVPLADAWLSAEAVHVADLGARLGLGGGPGPGVLLPVTARGRVAAVLAAGVSPRLPLDAPYLDFIRGVAEGAGEALGRDSAVERAERERLSVLERMTDGFFAFDDAWRFTYVNPEAERMMGRRARDLVGRGVWEAFPELVGSEVFGHYQRALHDQVAVSFTAPSPGGRWLATHVYPSPSGLAVFAHDVTEERRLEEERAAALRREREAREAAEAAERRLRELVEGVDAIVWEARTDPPGFTFVNEHARHLLGYALERWLEPGFWERVLVHPDDRAAMVEACTSAIRAGRDHVFEYRVRAADGRTVWVRDLVRVSPEPGGGASLRGVMVDTTARKRDEEELRRLAALVESTSDAVLGKSADGTILSWNSGAERIFGWREDDVVGAPVFRIVPPELHAEEREALARVARGERVTHFETERIRRDGRRITVSLTLSPMADAEGRVTGMSAIARDITDQKRLEAQLRMAQKMEAVGRLAGGVAHDFNNLLTAIRGNAGLLLAELPAGTEVREEVEEIEAAARRAGELTRQLLAFSRRQMLQPKVLDLNAVVGGVERMLRRLIPEDVALEVRPGEGLGRVRADPGQVEQVVINLAVNARDAMPSGGRLTVSTGNVRAPGAPGEHPVYVAPGEYVRLEVADTGRGMDDETLSHLFEPFFTTKPPGEGTGLGLSTVYGIVKQSGGYVWAVSAPGRGSRFVVLLPRAEGEAAPLPRPEAHPGAGEGGSGTVLLVEDEDSVRSLSRRVLERSGYRVLEASDGERALEAAAGHPAHIDLLLTDVVMPGGSGRVLAERMLRVRPEMRVLYMSGYAGEAIAEHGLAPDIDLIAKPFTPAELVRRVKGVMER